MSSFFIPFCLLSFYYAQICRKIRRNLNTKVEMTSKALQKGNSLQPGSAPLTKPEKGLLTGAAPSPLLPQGPISATPKGWILCNHTKKYSTDLEDQSTDARGVTGSSGAGSVLGNGDHIGTVPTRSGSLASAEKAPVTSDSRRKSSSALRGKKMKPIFGPEANSGSFDGMYFRSRKKHFLKMSKSLDEPAGIQPSTATSMQLQAQRSLPEDSRNQPQTRKLDHRPRAHSLEGMSRAKAKSVNQTIVIIVSYVMCSIPAVGIKLWAMWWDKSKDSIGLRLFSIIILWAYR